MARLRRAPVPDAGDVPLELTDPDHPAWTTDAGAQAVADRHGLEVRWTRAGAHRDPDWQRFADVRQAWAERAGLLTTWGGLDYKALAEAGVCSTGGRSPRRIVHPDGSVTDVTARWLIVRD